MFTMVLIKCVILHSSQQSHAAITSTYIHTAANIWCKLSLKNSNNIKTNR